MFKEYVRYVIHNQDLFLWLWLDHFVSRITVFIGSNNVFYCCCIMYSHVYLFIILCRHTEDMIKKLESAGLGFYVRDSQQKLGIILTCVYVPYSVLIAKGD